MFDLLQNIVYNSYVSILVIYLIIAITLSAISSYRIKFKFDSLAKKIYLLNLLIILFFIAFFTITITLKLEKIYTDKPYFYTLILPLFSLIQQFYATYPAMLFQLIYQYWFYKSIK
jgi:hypothetical protein